MNKIENKEPEPGPEPEPKINRVDTVRAALDAVPSWARKPIMKGRAESVIKFDGDGLPWFVAIRRNSNGVMSYFNGAVPITTDHPFVTGAKRKLQVNIRNGQFRTTPGKRLD